MLRRFDSINMLREKNICVLFPSWLEKEQKTKPYPQTNVFNASHSIIDGNSVKGSQHSRPRSGTSSMPSGSRLNSGQVYLTQSFLRLRRQSTQYSRLGILESRVFKCHTYDIRVLVRCNNVCCQRTNTKGKMPGHSDFTLHQILYVLIHELCVLSVFFVLVLMVHKAKATNNKYGKANIPVLEAVARASLHPAQLFPGIPSFRYQRGPCACNSTCG